MSVTNSISSRLLRRVQGNHSDHILPIPGYDDAVRSYASLLAPGVLLENLATSLPP